MFLAFLASLCLLLAYLFSVAVCNDEDPVVSGDKSSSTAATATSAVELVNNLDLVLEWYAPFYSGGGYSSEAIAAFRALRLLASTSQPNLTVASRQHGDSVSQEFINGLTSSDKAALYEGDSAGLGRRSGSKKRKFVVSICHSEPGAWSTPYPRYHTQNACPPRSSDFSIGRTMFETDRLPDGWADRMKYMDEIWVPTVFAYDIFVKAGVDKLKLRVVEEAVDTSFYSPYPNLHPFPIGTEGANKRNSAGLPLLLLPKSIDPLGTIFTSNFVFLFVGKWEKRKNVQNLVLAFIREFKLLSTASLVKKDNVMLAILTSSYHSNDDFVEEIVGIVKRDDDFNDGKKSKSEKEKLVASIMSRIVVLNGIPQVQMPDLYRSIDVLLIPSHGEGWGRPHIEAMSTGKPVIFTNWSGPTHFIDNSTGYPISVEDQLISTPGWDGHKWANPRIEHIQQLMRHTYSAPSEVSAKGALARESVKAKYSLEAMALVFEKELARIVAKLTSQRGTGRSSAHHNEL